MRINLTYEAIMAAARDAGNASMRKAGRKHWSKADWAIACAVSCRLQKLLVRA